MPTLAAVHNLVDSWIFARGIEHLLQFSDFKVADPNSTSLAFLAELLKCLECINATLVVSASLLVIGVEASRVGVGVGLVTAGMMLTQQVSTPRTTFNNNIP